MQELARLNGSVTIIRFHLLLVGPSGDVKMRGSHWSVICTIDLICNKVGWAHNIVLMMGMLETIVLHFFSFHVDHLVSVVQ